MCTLGTLCTLPYSDVMSWVSVSAAATRVGRSPQWIRNQIHSGALPAHTQPAGSRQRLLIMSDDLDRLVAGLRIEPISKSAPPPVRPASEQSNLTVDDVVASAVMAENARLKQENRVLRAQVTTLRSVVREFLDGFVLPGDHDDAAAT